MTLRLDDQDDPFGASRMTTPTKDVRVNRMQAQRPDTAFSTARMSPAVERAVEGEGRSGGQSQWQGRLSPMMKRALSPDSRRQGYSHYCEQLPSSRSNLPLSSSEDQRSASRSGYWEQAERSYITPTKSSFDTDAPRSQAQLHDLSGPGGLPYIPRDESDLGASPSRRSTLEGEGAIGWPSPPKDWASTDRLVAKSQGGPITVAPGVPISLVQALGFGSSGDIAQNQAVADTGDRWEGTPSFRHRPMSSDSTYRTSIHQYPPHARTDSALPAAPRLIDLNRPSTHGRPFADLDPQHPRRDVGVTAGPAYGSSSEPYRRKTSTRKYRRLESQPLQSTTYFAGGRLLTGGDSILPLIGSFIIVLGLGGLWLGTTGVWMWRDGLGGGGAGAGGKAAVIIFGYLLGTCVGAMIATAFRDPGILPRNLDPTFPVSHTSSTGTLVPYTRDLRVKNGTVTVKYCETCKIYRPPRSSHCRLCGNCVEGIDHHCSYLHNCVGKRNYSSFISFLITAVLGVIYTIVFSAIHYRIMTSRRDISFGSALRDSPGSAVSFAIGVVIVWPVMALLAYHLRLMFLNSTTIEQIRKSESRGLIPTGGAPPSNVFAYSSHLKNFFHSACRAQSSSWVDASGWEVDDGRLINPGVVQAWEESRRGTVKNVGGFQG